MNPYSSDPNFHHNKMIPVCKQREFTKLQKLLPRLQNKSLISVNVVEKLRNSGGLNFNYNNKKIG